MLYGVDIHARYQGSIDLALLKRQGYSFMVTKASEGTSIPSGGGLGSGGFANRFLEWITQARKLGMVPGLYHWLKAGNARAQAQFFHALVVRAGGPAGMLIQLDCEDNAGYSDVQIWAEEWRKLTGGHPFTMYTGEWWWGPRGWDGNRVTPYLWHSHYLTADTDTIPDDPAAFAARIPASWWTPGYGKWSTATILQFTSKGDAGSLGNNVDLNAFRGTIDQLRALTNGDDDMPTAEELWDKATPAKSADGGNPNGHTAGALLAWTNQNTYKILDGTAALRVQVTALTGAVEKLAAAVGSTPGGAAIDTAAILAHIDAKVAALAIDTRDAVADLGEGGAAQVRAD